MDNIISALISAIAAVIVALIGRTPAADATRREVQRFRPPGRRGFVVALVVLAAWVIASPIAIHHDLPAINILTLFVGTLIVGVVWPVQGAKAAASVLGLHALNSVAEPVARMVGGYQYNPFGGYDAQGIIIMTGLAVLNAAAVGFLCRWRLGKLTPTLGGMAPLPAGGPGQSKGSGSVPRQASPADFVGQLEAISRLHDKGAISDDEFRQAKKRILGNED